MGPVGTQSIRKSSTRLADGREIVYFDESPGLGRELVTDTRDLPPRPPGPPLPAGSAESGIRWDPLAGEWVVIAAGRQDRTLLPPPHPSPGGAAPDRGPRGARGGGEGGGSAAPRQDRTFLPPPDQCPLDPSAPGRLTEIPAPSYDVVVFENRFPSLREPL